MRIQQNIYEFSLATTTVITAAAAIVTTINTSKFPLHAGIVAGSFT